MLKFVWLLDDVILVLDDDVGWVRLWDVPKSRWWSKDMPMGPFGDVVVKVWSSRSVGR